MKLALKKASTNVTVNIFIQDTSSPIGAGLTGLAYNTTSLVCYYVRPAVAAAVQALATQSVAGSHSDGGFVEVDATNMPGVYRLDLKDLVCATGVDHVVVMLKGAANMAPVVLEIQLTNFDMNDGVRGGLTALPNAAAQSTGGLMTGTSNQFTPANFVAGAIDASAIAADAIGSSELAASAVTEIRDSIWAKTITELTGVPGATPTVGDILQWLLMISRNKRTATSTLSSVTKDNGVAFATAVLSDTAGTTTKAEYS